MRRFFATAGIVAAMVVGSLVTAPQPDATASSQPAGTAPGGNWSAPGSGAAPAGGTLNGGAPAPQPVKPAVAPKPVTSTGSNPHARFASGKLIEISIPTQTLTAWENGRRVMSFKISTGRPGFPTPKGEFKVRAKGLKWWSRKWKVWMPYAMNFYQNYNLHSLPYARPGHLIGANRLGRPDSHGCIRIGPANAKALYAWAPVGTPVWIH